MYRQQCLQRSRQAPSKAYLKFYFGYPCSSIQFKRNELSTATCFSSFRRNENELTLHRSNFYLNNQIDYSGSVRRFSSGNCFGDQCNFWSPLLSTRIVTPKFTLLWHDGLKGKVANVHTHTSIETSKDISPNNEKMKSVKTSSLPPNVLKSRKAALRQRVRARKALKRLGFLKEAPSLQIIERSKADFEVFFDQTVAPRTLFPRIKNLLRLLERAKIKQHQQLLKKKPADVSTELELENQSKKKSENTSVLPLETVFLNMLYSTNPVNSLQVDVLEYLLSTTRKIKAGDGAEKDIAIDAANHEQFVTTLMSARESIMYNDICWSNVDANELTMLSPESHANIIKSKIDKQNSKPVSILKDEAEDLLLFLRNSLPSSKFMAVMDMFHLYAEKTKFKSETSLNLNLASGQVDVLEKNVATGQETPSKNRFLVKLGTDLVKSTGTHFHLVCEKVALFLYIDIIKNIKGSEKTSNILVSDPRFVTSKRNYQEVRKLFVESLSTLQSEISQSLIVSNSTSLDPIIEENIPPLELDNPVPVVAPSGKIDGRYTRRGYAKFEAEVIFESIASQMEHNVFIDNLPIDITESEIRELYSRFGKLDSIRIFNKRPDLDPGPLDKSKLAERRKNRLNQNSRRRWVRPRTPVYALLSFADKASYDKAVDDSLRIFGMLIRKHPVRSIRPSDMNMLYLECLPDVYRCNELELRLAEVLTPDVNVGMSAGQNAMTIVGSCEIKFPSYDAAYNAFLKLEGECFLNTISTSEDFAINWMRSPFDSQHWWSRKQGFD